MTQDPAGRLRAAGFVPIPHDGRTIWAMSDVYKRGEIRTPVDVPEAMEIASDTALELGVAVTLPTRAHIDSVHRAADVRLVMPTRPPGPDMVSEAAARAHNAQIEQVLAGRGGLISGHKKEILQPERAGRVTIYGGMKADGTFWQSRPSSVHGATYKDYSHGLRLVYDPDERGETPMKSNKAILEAAGAYLGLEEWPGAASNPAVDEMFDDVGHGWADDSTPWCAAYVGSVLASLGLPHTGDLAARSYENYGAAVSIQNAQPGDIVVFWRGSPSSWQGHVAFLVRFEGDKVIVRGGNQGNKVSDAAYPIDRIVAIRRADGVEAEGKRPVLRNGDRGAFVLDLQNQLVTLGYMLGKQDGVFGSRTLAAVVAFQADADLVADGIVGPKTWAALAAGKARPERDVTEDDLAGRSRTYDTAASGKNVATVGGAIATATVAISEAQNVVSVAQEAEGLLEQIGTIAPSVIAIVAVAAVAYFAWKNFDKIRAIRIEDAQTGRNDGV
jgi:uncharacterized protein (TIGR02594 family)